MKPHSVFKLFHKLIIFTISFMKTHSVFKLVHKPTIFSIYLS